jgi:hypothetical protein
MKRVKRILRVIKRILLLTAAEILDNLLGKQDLTRN